MLQGQELSEAVSISLAARAPRPGAGTAPGGPRLSALLRGAWWALLHALPRVLRLCGGRSHNLPRRPAAD